MTAGEPTPSDRALPLRLAPHTLMPLLLSPRTLKRAARRCMRRRAGPGIDGVTWRQYRIDLDSRLHRLNSQLASDTWRPGSARMVRATHFSGSTSLLAVPNVEDRIVHRALRLVMEPVLEANAFRDFVSGYRPRRNRLTAVRLANAYLNAGRTWVADVDVAQITSYGTTDRIVDLLARHVSDGSFLLRVRRALDGFERPLQPGSGLSPLLTNLVLIPVDEPLADVSVARFCDNYCVFCESEQEAKHAMDLLRSLLEGVGFNASARKSVIRANPNPEDLFLLGE